MPKIQTQPSPTLEIYSFLQGAFDSFNDLLFGGVLSRSLITLRADNPRVLGFFSPKRFARVDGMQNSFVHEIAFNPTYFGSHPILESLQTLAHEMVHQWQYEYGNPGRARYHNAEFADKMESIGLMPSADGLPGGKRVGEAMGDYAIPGGRFLEVCGDFLAGRPIPFFDRAIPSGQGVSFGVLSARRRFLGEGCPPELLIIPSRINWDLVPKGGDGRLDFAGYAQLVVAFMDRPGVASSEDAPRGAVARLAEQIALVETLGAGAHLQPAAPVSAQEDLSGIRELMVDVPSRPTADVGGSNRAKYNCPACGMNVWGKPGLKILCGEDMTRLNRVP